MGAFTASLLFASLLLAPVAQQAQTGSVATQRAPGVRISGRVTRDPRLQVYTNQLRVRITRGASATVAFESEVAPDGTFEFPKVGPGAYKVRVYPGSADFSSADIEVSDKDITNLVLTMPLTVPGSVRIVSNSIVPRVTLSFTNLSGMVYKPELHATYGLPAIPPTPGPVAEQLTFALPEGDYRVALADMAAGYELKSIREGATDLLKEPLRVVAGNSPELSIALAIETPEPWVRVRGRVVRAPGAPLASRVFIYGPSAYRHFEAPIRADGTFEFPRILPGAYRAGSLPEIPGTPVISLNVGRTDITDLEFPIPRVKEVRGRITGNNGSLPPRIELTFDSLSQGTPVEPMRFSPTLRPDGTFSMVLPEGDYRLVIDEPSNGYRIQSMQFGNTDLRRDQTVKVAAADPSEINITTDFASPAPWRKVSGNVSGPGASKVTLSMANMAVRVPALETPIRPDGTFEFPRVPPGQYTARLAPPMLAAPEKSIAVEDQDVTLDLVTPVMRTISGRVDSPNGGMTPRFYISLIPSNGLGPIGATALVQPDRHFEVTIPEGEYRVDTLDLSANFRIQSITYGKTDLSKEPLKVAGSDLEVLHVTFAPDSSLARVRVTGHVTDAEGLGPKATARVLLNGSGLSQTFQVTLDANDNFAFDNIPAGKYSIQAVPGLGTLVSSATQSEVAILEVKDKDILRVELRVR